jgi:hypothetical protein
LGAGARGVGARQVSLKQKQKQKKSAGPTVPFFFIIFFHCFIFNGVSLLWPNIFFKPLLYDLKKASAEYRRFFYFDLHFTHDFLGH